MKWNIFKSGLLFLIVLLCSLKVYSLPTDWNYTVTANNHQILIQSGTTAVINGQQLSPGDYFGVFFIDSSDEFKCGGYSMWTGTVNNVAAWGEDVGDDGFEAGETFYWKIWDASENIDYFATPVYFGYPFTEQGQYVTNGMSGLTSLTAITLPWDYTITSANHTILVSSDTEVTLDNLPVSAGDYIGVFFGYQNALHCGGYAVWTGNTTSIAAWGSDQGGDGFAVGEIFIFKIWNHITGESWFAIPEYMDLPMPDQGNFQPNGMSGLESLSAFSAHVPWNYTVTSGNHSILIPQTAQITIDSEIIDPGDYIGVFYDSSGILACGGYVCWEGVTTSLAAWAQDIGDDGFEPGEAFTWKIWKHSTGEEYISVATYMGSPMPNQEYFANNGMSGLISLSYITPIVPWQYVVTGVNHSILIPASAQMTIDGQSISQGDYIGVFYYTNGIPACGGYLQWTGQTNALTAWGDDAQTQVKDGFADNELFDWKVWQASSGEVFDATAVYLPNPPMPNSAYYTTNGLSGISQLIALSSETQNINLALGWSIFSTYISPFDSSISILFSSISQYVIIVKDGGGNIYWPQYGVNNIGNLVLGKGYQIKMNSAQVIAVTGDAAVPEITPVNLNTGWNIIGFLRKSPAPVVTQLSSIVSGIIIVKDGAGNIYWPVYGVNNIGNMLPGAGYQLKITSSAVFYYSPN